MHHRDGDAHAVAAPKIHDYGLIGDCRSAALVSRGGSLDWLCWPRFESPPIFAGLLDPVRGGCWRISPTVPSRITRRYIEHTNVLETRFDTVDGACVLTDLMTIASEEDKTRILVPDHEVLRRIDCVRGEVELAIRVEPRFCFGHAPPRITQHPQLGIRWQFHARLLALRADVPLILDSSGDVHATIRIRAGESATLSLIYDEEAPAMLPMLGDHARERIDRSVAWWQAWSARATYHGPDREQVLRSALAIKLMSFAPSGAIIAAPTTSLPETLGGPRNWDYRYCWLRDAAFTSRALLSLGYIEDAQAYGSWLLHTTRLSRPELRVLYDVYGREPEREREVPDLAGYRGSRPVRFGNAADDQLQLDMYGEVIDAVAQLACVAGSLDRDTQKLLREFGSYIVGNWRRADQGIWEPRGAPAHRTHSRLMCWVGLDRLIGLAERRLVGGIDRDVLAAEREAIRADLEDNAFDVARQCYAGAYDHRELDASVLLMSWYGYHSPDAPRMRSTFARLSDQLGAGPGLLYRYEHSRKTGEGAFWICSFWAIEHLAMGGGTLAEARALMTAACSYASDLGLMAEEVDPLTGEGLGNFPQAYTHVGLINAALSIEQRAKHSTADDPRLQPLLKHTAAAREVQP